MRYDACPPWRLQPVDHAVFRTQLDSDGLTGALDAFGRLLKRPDNKRYKTGALGIDDDHLAALACQAGSLEARRDPAGFFASQFTPFSIKGRGASGLLTGFYEPEAEASLTQSRDFQIPLYARPADLIEIDDDCSNADVPDGYRFGRRSSNGAFKQYHDRQAIESGALADRRLEIAWLRDPVTAFFIHIQGAALLQLTDGSKMRVTYAAKSGHPFTGIGRLLVEQGEISQADISMQSIKAWLADHPDRAQALMWQNRSFIFFRKTEYHADDPGPIAAAKVPLTPKRSIAVDRTIHTFGTPFFIRSDNINDAPFARLMIAQDTGSAISGAARADLFFGTGDAAGELAGGVNAQGEFTILIPNEAVPAVLERTGEATA